MKNRLVCVYGIRCKVTKRIYIGSSVDLKLRLKRHFKELTSSSGKHSTTGKECYFQSDFNEFGIDSFDVFVIEQNIPECMRNEREEYWIDKYQSTNPRYGYNLLKKCSVTKKLCGDDIGVSIYYECPPFPELEGDVSECESEHT